MRVELDDVGEKKRKITVELQGEKVRLQVKEKDKIKAEASVGLGELKQVLGMLTSGGTPESEEPEESGELEESEE